MLFSLSLSDGQSKKTTTLQASIDTPSWCLTRITNWLPNKENMSKVPVNNDKQLTDVSGSLVLPCPSGTRIPLMGLALDGASPRVTLCVWLLMLMQADACSYPLDSTWVSTDLCFPENEVYYLVAGWSDLKSLSLWWDMLWVRFYTTTATWFLDSIMVSLLRMY